MSGLYCVITTIQPPTASVARLVRKVEQANGTLVVVGDHKGPSQYQCQGDQGWDSVRFFAFADQPELPFKLAGRLPTGHYARKNIGYLWAMAERAAVIYETDDDNAPMPHWSVRTQEVTNCRVVPKRVAASGRPGGGWYNIYKNFSDEFIWPRGFPLDRVRQGAMATADLAVQSCSSPIQQGLVNGSPDVDALWRIVFDRDFVFSCRQGLSVLLSPGNWCPFNTQNTWFWPDAYPLLYIPSHCSFRMCDIWKGLVAQRCLWETGRGVIFHAPDVVQERNSHNILNDFEHEVPGYLHNARIAELLEEVTLSGSMGDCLHRCYEALVLAGIFPGEEMTLVESWLEDLENTRLTG